MDDRDICHSAEAGLCELDRLDTIADDGRGGDVAVDTAVDARADIGGAVDDNGVVGGLEAVVRAELEGDLALAVHVAACDLVDAAAAACGDLQERAAHVLGGDNRVDGLGDLVELPPHGRCDEGD